nr:MAG TPA: hypothetical protein [Bacteriophage sp.]
MEKKRDHAYWARVKLIGMASNLRKKGKTVEEIYEILSEKYTTAQIDDAVETVRKADEIRKKQQ